MTRRASFIMATLVAMLGMTFTSTLHAQTRRPATRSRTTASKSSDLLAVRAEYAAVLLQAEKYKEAAKEYRALVELEPRNTNYRLGLARALAWGNRFGEADRELRILVAQRPNDPAVAALVRTVRTSYDPPVEDAQAWVAERPAYTPYRVALADALVREHRPREAIAQYDTLLAVRDSAPLLVAIAEAYRAAGDRAGGIARVRSAVDRQPADTAVRHAYALVLTSAKAYDAAAAQYDTLIAQAQAAPFYLDRARVNQARDRQADAEADARAALARKPSLEGYLLLGELYRQSGNYAGARLAYDNARILAPTDARVAMARAAAERESHPVIGFIPEYDDGYAWQTSALASGDNIGTSYATLGVRRGLALPQGLAGSVGVEVRRLGANDRFESRAVNGVAADAGATKGFTSARIGARAGIAAHSAGGAIPYFSVAATAWKEAYAASIEATGGPSYPSLLTLASLDDIAGGKAITERSLRLSLGGPVQLVDVALSGERALMSDGNTRLTFEGLARYQLSPGIAAVYALSVLRFAERSERYWDPKSYVSNAAGLEAATRQLRGWSAAVRLLPGFAQADETGSLARVTAGTGTRTTVGQLTANGELSYRARTWELAFAGSYGRGRSGGYQRAGASAVLRVTP
jgi:tetratricopeptide (TPR) repeat protein